MVLEGILVGVAVTGFGFCIKTCVDLKERVTRVEIIQRLQLKKNGVHEEEIDCELNNNRGKK